MITPIFALLLILAPYQTAAYQVSDAKKREFIELLNKLPHKGEFFTDEGVRRAGPYLPVLLALTAKDIEGMTSTRSQRSAGGCAKFGSIVAMRSDTSPKSATLS